LLWSPDGKQIAFYTRGHENKSTVKVIPAEGGTPRTVVQDAKWNRVAKLSWSPDGSRIAYMDKEYKVRTAPVNGTGEGEIVPIDLEDATIMEAVWSPDGSQFVFRALTGTTRSGQDYRLWLMEDFLTNTKAR
jgi:Tol biopolymer transport system component